MPRNPQEGDRRQGAANAIINIRNLRLRTFIGFNPEEMEKKQDVVINIEINYAVRQGVLDDHVDDALNYKVITKRVIHLVEEGRFLLLEKLVADVLEANSGAGSPSGSRFGSPRGYLVRHR